MDKQRDYTKLNVVNKSQFIGDPSDIVGKYVIIVDDIADTLGTMMACVNELVKLGALGVYIVVTHAYLNGPAIDHINGNEHVRKVICTDSIPQASNLAKTEKLHVVSIAPLLTDVIYRIQASYEFGKLGDTSLSISQLFE